MPKKKSKEKSMAEFNAAMESKASKILEEPYVPKDEREDYIAANKKWQHPNKICPIMSRRDQLAECEKSRCMFWSFCKGMVIVTNI